MLSDSYLVWPVDVHHPKKCNHPGRPSVFIHCLQTRSSSSESPLPSKCYDHLQIGLDKPPSAVRPFFRGSSGESGSQIIRHAQFFGKNQSGARTWLEKCKESGREDCEYWVELPTRNQGEKEIPTYVEIDRDGLTLQHCDT